MADRSFDEPVARAARVYSAAADRWTAPALSFWSRFGTATVARVPLKPGDAVLDLCCGAGASALPAARAVGPTGRVTAVDLAEPLLAHGRTIAAAERLTNIDFLHADARGTGLAGGTFDAVICVFGLFFVPDMRGFLSEMWRLVRPGGTLAVTTWGPGLFEPANQVFWGTVRVVEPALYKAFNPWDVITTPEALGALFEESGIPDVRVEAMSGEQPLAHPHDFWDIVLGSGYRGTFDALTPDQQDVLRERILTQLAERDIRAVRTDVVFGLATREDQRPLDSAETSASSAGT